MASSLITALKKFNHGSSMWSVPRKETPAHNTLLHMIRGKTLAVEKAEKKVIHKKPKNSMNITL